MAYAAICNIRCIRIFQYANPDIMHAGEPTGVVGVSEAAQVLTENMPAIARYFDENSEFRPYWSAPFSIGDGIADDTTLFEITNPDELEDATCTLTYLGEAGEQLLEPVELSLPKHVTTSINIRDTGIRGKGVLRAECDRNIVGNWFTVNTAGASARGEQLVFSGATQKLCPIHIARFFNGGAFAGGSQITFTILDADGESGVNIRGFADDGSIVLSTSRRFTNGAWTLTPEDLGVTEPFGYLKFDFFDVSVSGQVELTAFPLFSVGFSTACIRE